MNFKTMTKEDVDAITEEEWENLSEIEYYDYHRWYGEYSGMDFHEPLIDINWESNEADVCFAEFDKLDSLRKADLLKDLAGIFTEKYNSIIEDDNFLKDLV